MSLEIVIGTVFSKILSSSRSSRLEVFNEKKRAHNNFKEKRLCQRLFLDKATGWRPETLLKRGLSTDIFLCVFWNTRRELLDIFLLLVDFLFWCCCYCWCCHIKFLINYFLTPLGRQLKSCFHVVSCLF